MYLSNECIICKVQSSLKIIGMFWKVLQRIINFVHYVLKMSLQFYTEFVFFQT